jgi:Domain of unknown function (DUF4160)
VGVPTISRFHGIVIQMYWDDHPFPHFHARAAGREAKVRVDQIEVIESTLTRKQLRMVCEWAAVHQSELEKNWQRARNGGTLIPIEPWK